MAKELGISYNKYYAIEKGSVKMPTNLIDKFNKIINRGKENEITKIDNLMNADRFWEEMKQRTGKHTFKLHEKMEEFNISTIKELAELLGYKSAGIIHNCLQGRECGVNFKKRLYNFFNDELNIQIPKEEKPVKNTTYNYLDRYYEETDFKKIMKEYCLTNLKIGAEVGTHASVISRMTNKTWKPSYKIIQKVKDYLDKVISSQNKLGVKKFEYKHSQKALNFFNTFNLSEWLKEQNITPTEFANMCDLSEGTIYNFDNYKGTNRIPIDKTILRIKNAVEEYERENKKEMKIENKEEYISKAKLIEECEKEIEQNNEKIRELQKQIDEINAKNVVSTKFIALVKSLQ